MEAVSSLALLFASVTSTYHLPTGLLGAICYVESGHKVAAINHHDGGSSSLGTCQIKINTARLVGFKGTEKQLMEPANNVKYAGAYLAYQIKRYNHIPSAVAAYNAGSLKLNSKGKIVNQKYVDLVFNKWLENL